MLQDGSSAEVMAEFEHDGSDSELDPLERDELKAPRLNPVDFTMDFVDDSHRGIWMGHWDVPSGYD